MAIRHVRQGKNECTLAVIAMLADASLDDVRALACKAAGVAEWRDLWGPSGRPRRAPRHGPDPYWAGVQAACTGLARGDLWGLIAFRVPAGGEVLSNRLRKLPAKGRGIIRFKFPRSQHICAWENGLIFDSDVDGDPEGMTLAEYRKRFPVRVQQIVRQKEMDSRGFVRLSREDD